MIVVARRKARDDQIRGSVGIEITNSKCEVARMSDFVKHRRLKCAIAVAEQDANACLAADCQVQVAVIVEVRNLHRIIGEADPTTGDQQDPCF